MEDRTRFLRGIGSSNDPAHALKSAGLRFHLDMWETQPWRVEAWVEKDALVGVLQRPCNKYDVDFFSCRGYTGQTAMHNAAKRIIRLLRNGQNVLILHLSDHDPSGVDMGRDIDDRLRTFGVYRRAKENGVQFEYRRIALTMDQVDEFSPPPNPAKITDPRAGDYIATYGDTSWELDALEPSYINDLVCRMIADVIDEEAWNERVDEEREGASLLYQLSGRWGKITKGLNPREPDAWASVTTWCDKIGEEEDDEWGEEGDPEVEDDFDSR
jgi:hypothetical protein